MTKRPIKLRFLSALRTSKWLVKVFKRRPGGKTAEGKAGGDHVGILVKTEQTLSPSGRLPGFIAECLIRAKQTHIFCSSTLLLILELSI